MNSRSVAVTRPPTGILGQAGLRERNLIGTGIDAGINGTLAALQSQVDISATDPYFLDRNLVAGADIFYLNNNNQYVSDYSETRYGVTLAARLRLQRPRQPGLHLHWSATANVNDISQFASIYVQDEAGVFTALAGRPDPVVRLPRQPGGAA